MDYLKIREIAALGRKQLENGIFPSELLEEINDKRARKDAADQIFYPKDGPKPNALNNEEKETRAKRLKVEIAFQRYMDGIASYSLARNYFAIIALVLLAFELSRPFGNWPHIAFSFAMTATMFVFSFSRDTIKSKAMLGFYVAAALMLIELIVFQWPTPIIFGNHFDLSRRVGSLWQLFNALTPFLYLGAKLGVLLAVYLSASKIVAFKPIKKSFEEDQ